MVAIVSGNSLGLDLTSLRTLGQQGAVGEARHGRSGESVYVNAANGNLVLQDRDDILVARGPDAEVLRTYNSQGLLNDDNADNWTDGVAPRGLQLAGAIGAVGSTVTRTDRDGSAALYTWDSAAGAYATTEGDGAYDSIRFVAADNQFEWKDGPTGARQRYEASGALRMLSSIDAAGNAMAFGYDAGGRLARTTAANGDVTWYDRTGADLTQVRTVTAQGVTSVLVRYGYDADHRLTSVAVDLGAGATYTTLYTYEGTSKRVASLTQSDGTALTFTYISIAGASRVATITDAAGSTTSFAYDTAGRLQSTTVAGLTTRYAVDTAGRLTGITPPGAAQQSLSFTWDPAGNVATVTDGAGRTTTFGYASGNRTLERDAAGNTVERRFNARNQVVWECRYTVPDPDGAGSLLPSGALPTRFVYDRDGRNLLRFTVSPDGRVVENRYDAFGGVAATLSYSATYTVPSGLAPDGLTLDTMEAWAAASAGSVAQRSDTTYNARGQVESVTTYARVTAAGTGVADGTQVLEQFVYDQRGRLLQRISPSGTSTTYTHDGLGRELTRNDATGRLTVTQYQDTARKTVVTAANGLVTTSTFDAAGRLVATLRSTATSANLGQTTYAYDAGGRLRMSTDPTGVRSWWLWNDAGWCVGEVDGNGTLTENAHDASGLLLSRTVYATAANTALLVDGTGNAIVSATLAGIRPAGTAADAIEWRMYDAAGRLSRSAKTIGTGAFAAVTEYGYDGASRLVRQTGYVSGIAISSIVGGVIPLPASSAQDRTTRSFFDGDGRLLGTLDAEGYLVRQLYDGAGRLVQRIAHAPATTASLRAAGTLDQLVPASHAADQRTVTFYDAKGQVSAVVDPEGFMTEYAYDSAGRLVRSTRYASRVTVAITPGAAPSSFRPATSAADQVTTRSYDSLDRLVQETTPDGVSATFSYDTAGLLASTTRAAGTSEERKTLVRFDAQGRKTAELGGEGAALLLAGLSQSAVDAVWAQHGVTHTYDSAGRRTSTADGVGQKTLYYYNADGDVVFTVNALGEIAESRFDTLGRETARIRRATRVAITGLTGGLITASVQAALTPSSTADSVETITYTRDGRVASRTDASGSLASTTFNAFGDVIGTGQLVSGSTMLNRAITVDRRGQQVTAVTDPGGLNLVTSAAYDAFGRIVSTTDAIGKVSTRSYDRLGRTVTLTDPLNATRTTAYDAFDRVLTQTDATGATTTYAYDTVGRSVRVTTPENVSTVTVRNRHGQVQTVTDGKGQVITSTYDRKGRLLQTATALTTTSASYDAAGRLLLATDANGKSVRYAYDAADRVLTRTVDPGGLAIVTSWTYDAKGQAVTMTDGNGSVTSYGYDTAGRVLRQTVDPSGLNLQTVFTYDNRGKTLTVTSPQGTVTQSTYDVAGRRTRETVGGTTALVSTAWTYDAEGRATSATDGAGNVTRYAYDAAGQLVYTVDPAGGVRQQVYDAAGRVVKTVSPAAAISMTGLSTAATVADIQQRVTAQAQDQVEHRVYDRDGRLAATVDGTGAVVRYAYDANGNVTSRIAYAKRIVLANWQPGTLPVVQADATRDRSTSAVYDALDRQVFTLDGTGAVVEQAYDGNGNVLRRTAYARAVTVTGALSQSTISAAVTAIADASRDSTVRSTWDAANRQTWTADGTGAVVQRTYDRNGNVVRETAYANAVAATASASSVVANAAADRVTSRYYDAANRLVFEIDPVNAVRETTYDRDGRALSQVAYAAPAGTVPTPGASGALAALRTQYPAVGTADRVTRFAYDAAGRAIARMDAEGAVTKLQYDAAGRLVSTTALATKVALPTSSTLAQLLPSTVSDAAADRVTRRVFDAAGRVQQEIGGSGEVTGYEYDALGQVLRKTRFAKALPATGGATAPTPDPAADRVEAFTHDAAGNVLSVTDSMGLAESFTYDALGGKLSFTNRKGAVWRYDRDAAGRVVEETSPQVQITTAAVDAAGVVSTSAATTASIVTRFGYDALGNLSQRTEAAGRTEQRITRYEYDAAGRQVRVVHPLVGTYDAAADNLASNGATGVATRTERVSTPESRTFYDALGNAVAGLDVGGALSQKVYDKAGRIDYEIDAIGQVTRYTRNAFGEVTVLTRYAAATLLPNRTVASAAQSATRTQVVAALPAVAAAADRTVNTGYDRSGRVVQVEEPEALTFNSVTGAMESTRARTQTAYNAFGEAIRESRLRNKSGVSAVTTHYYNQSGQEVATVDAMGYLTERGFDARGNMLEVREFATAIAAGGWNLTTYTRPAATTGTDRVTRYTYDRLDRKIAERRQDVEHSTTANGTATRGELVTSYGYDAVGNLTRTTDAAAGATYTAYDAMGRVTAVAAPARSSTVAGTSLTPVTTFRRDAYGNVVVQTEHATTAASASETGVSAGASSADDRITRNAYDAFGRAVASVDAQGETSYTSFDAWGHAAKTWRGVAGHDGAIRTVYQVNAYDKLGQLVRVVDPAAATANTVQNAPLARLTSIPGANQHRLTLAWAGLTNPSGGTVVVQVDYQQRYQDENVGTVYSWATASASGTAATAAGGMDVTWTAELETLGQIRVLQTVGGQLTQLWQGTLAQATGAVVSLQQSGTVTTDLEYDAFGALTRKGVQGGRQEYYDYDNAGRLWRTNAADGIDRIRLFDAQGNATAEIRSAGVGGANQNLRALDAATAAAMSGLRRTDTSYDLLGRVTSQTLAARADSASSAAVQRLAVSVSLQSTVPTYDEYEQFQSWSGMNVLSVSWNNIAALGSGDMQVRVDYVTRHYAWLPAVVRTWQSGVLDASAAADGISTSWQDGDQQSAGLDKVLRVVVIKKDVTGNWVVVLDQAPGVGQNVIDVTAPADPAVQTRLELRAAGSTGNTGWWAVPAQTDFGNVRRFDAAGLSAGGYEYKLTLISASGEERVVGTGSLNVTRPPLTAITATPSFGPAGDGVLAWSSPGAAMTQVFRYRPAGSTGAWSTLTVKPRGASVDGVDTSQLGAGTYTYELLWIPASTGIPSAHGTGQFTITAAVPSRWVPPVNLPHVNGARVVGSPGGYLNLVWDAFIEWTGNTTAQIRPAGGSWSSLSVITSMQGYDDVGNAIGYQQAGLGVPSPGTYEILVRAGSPTTHQFTATLTVYGESGGYYVTDWIPVWTWQPVVSYYVNGQPVYLTDEYGNVEYAYVLTWQPQSRWVPGTVAAPQLAMTTPPYTPGYWTTAIPTQYAVSRNASPGLYEISGNDGDAVAQSIATAETARTSRPQIVQTVDRWGNLLEISDARSSKWKTTYRYNAFNLVVQETRPATDAGTPVTQTYYDAVSRQVAVRDANGNVNGQVFDAGGNLVQERHADGGIVDHRFNAFGNRLQTVDAEGLLTTFTYDRLSRLLSRKQGIVAVFTVLGTNYADDGVQKQLADSWTYDQLGRKLTQTNGNGEVLRYRYDLRGNVVQTVQPLGQTLRATYDAQGRKISEVDANGLRATWTYDYFGRLTGHQDLGGATFAYSYDNAGQLVTQSSTRGQWLVYGYDAAGQQTSIWDGALGKQSTYAYDLAGRRIREVVVQGGVTYQDNHLSWDALGNLRAVADARVHMRMVYDRVGNRTRVTTTVDYQGVSGAASGSSDRFFRYDAMNRQTVVDAVDSSFNLGRQGHEITYDRNGNRKSDRWQVEGAGGVLTSTTEQYAYDAMNRLKTVSRGGVTIDTRRYDGASRVVQSGADGTLTAAQVAAMNQGVPAADAIGTDTRINRYDANGRLMHQKVLGVGMQAKSDLIWDPAETAGWSLPAAGYDAAGNTLGWSVRNWQSGPAIASYAVDLERFEGYVGKTSGANGTMVIPVMTTQQYDANGFLVSVTDPSRAEGNRTFVNDSAGRALLVNQSGRVQRQLIVNGEVLGIYGVGLDPTAIGQVGGNASFANVADFNFGYSKVTGAYPSATPGAYHVRPGDTLQSIAQSAYGDSKLWYRIADANGLASSSELKVGQTLNIPSGVGTISNNGGTFKPYDAARITGDLNPLALPPAGRDADCGGMGKLVMVAVAVAVTYWTGRVDAVKAFWATAFKTVAAAETAAAMATVATAATAAAAGSVASQAVGMLTGDVKSFSWQSVALSAISGGVTQGLGGGSPLIQDTFVRAAVANALSQGIGVVTGLQKRFDWRGVVASYVGSAVGQAVGDALGLRVDGTPGNMPHGEFLLKASLKGLVAGAAAAAARGGRLAIQQVAVDAFGNAVGSALGEAMQSINSDLPVEDAGAADVPTRQALLNLTSPLRLPNSEVICAADVVALKRETLSDPTDGRTAAADPASMKDEDFSKFLLTTVARRIMLSRGLDPDAPDIPDSVEPRPALFVPEFDGGGLTPVSEIGGHFRRPQLIGQAFIGTFSPNLGREFKQEDLNLMIAHSQFVDQLKDLDAVAAARRFLMGDDENRGAMLPRLIALAIHSLNNRGSEWNRARVIDLLDRNRGNLPVAGMLMHPYEDAGPHEGHGSVYGHLWRSVQGQSPDYITPENGVQGGKHIIKFFERVLGVDADSVTSKNSRTIRSEALSALQDALDRAGEVATSGQAFERAFNDRVGDLLSPGALKPPKLRLLNERYGSYPSEALSTTALYLRQIGLDVAPAGFLMDSLNAAAKVVNHYVGYSGMRVPAPFLPEQFLRSQNPVRSNLNREPDYRRM